AAGLARGLETDGHRVKVVHDGHEALAQAASGEPPDLMVLDLMLPGLDGFSVLRRVRDRGLDVPVLILSARGEDLDKVQGFRLGADDYVVKPVGLVELLLRVRAILRRAAPAGDGGVDQRTFGTVVVDLGARIVTRAGREVELTRLEFDLLACLLENRGRAVTRTRLLSQVWGYPDPRRARTRTLDTHVASLRAKLEVDPSRPAHIVTVRKVGYRIDG
ncbi:MAG: response regulator transcription factor, partial [Gemmatimonadetes bacterium]|nr:response regulator transcription factor [Gemmatimonadota bacterium]